MFDVKIINAVIYDGDGGEAFHASIGIKDGLIAEIGDCIDDSAKTLDAKGCIVTPGFVDLHTHYDGQISWDEEMRPSVNHGVTTALLGNCGVGFAPCREDDHDKLIRLMEGVEDIPGSALAEGLTWDWETFPEYMDAIDKVPHTIDFALLVPHDPIRVYAMGERAIYSEQANDDDIAKMHDLVREAMEAGAAGFSTGRTDIHRTADGDWTPSSEATAKELVGIGSALKGLDYGVLQAVSDFNLEREGDHFEAEFDIIESYFRAGDGATAVMSLMQRDMVPGQWLDIIKRAENAKNNGIDLRLQVAPRAIGVFLGLQGTFHPLMAFPSYIAIMNLPLKERVEKLRDPALKKQILSETPIKLAGKGSSVPPFADTMIAQTEQLAAKLFRLGAGKGGAPDYEQKPDQSVAAKAIAKGQPIWEAVYDGLLEDEGKAFLYFPVYNYTEMNYNNVLKMMQHPQAVMGLSDGGAHVGFICDASFPTYLLSHWTRRESGEISLARAVQMLTADGADFLRLTDRGRLKVGLRADINVIDYDNLSLQVPYMVRDLPAGGQRLLQGVNGYRATFVAGAQVVQDDEVTSARPGRLVRMGKGAA
jgi:N-acyl-D-aspartate/D-glutamate deacylase